MRPLAAWDASIAENGGAPISSRNLAANTIAGLGRALIAAQTVRTLLKGCDWMKILLMICAALTLCQAPALARNTAPPPTTYGDGAVGTAPVECGVGDPCAVLKLPNGDAITIYNGGGPHCQPYTLDVVRTHGDTVLFQNHLLTDDMATDPWLGGDRHPGQCYRFRSTYLTFDAGVARLGLFQAKDGSLFAEWSNGSTAPGMSATPAPAATP